MGMIKRSSALFVQSWSLLRSQPTLVLFPVVAGVAQALVMASFAVLLFATGGLKAFFQEVDQAAQGATLQVDHLTFWPIVLAFYLVTTFVQIFFSTALIGAAIEHFNGRPATIGSGLALASSRLPQILGWTVVTSTVGLVLQMIAERSGLVGRIVIALIGLGWSVASYFVLPVLAAEGAGPFTALRRSVETLKKSWGEGLVLNVGLGLAGGMLMFAAIIPAMIGIGISAVTQAAMPAIAGTAISIVLGVGIALVISTLSAIVRAALYQFATSGAAPTGFDRSQLESAFRRKA